MEKTLTIDGKQVRFKSTAATPLRYKAQFGNDFFTEIIKLNSLTKLKTDENGEFNIQDLEGDIINNLDFEAFYNIVWTMAKSANPNIPDPIAWLDSFDEFPLFEIIPELQGMLISSIQSSKKK